VKRCAVRGATAPVAAVFCEGVVAVNVAATHVDAFIDEGGAECKAVVCDHGLLHPLVAGHRIALHAVQAHLGAQRATQSAVHGRHTYHRHSTAAGKAICLRVSSPRHPPLTAHNSSSKAGSAEMSLVSMMYKGAANIHSGYLQIGKERGGGDLSAINVLSSTDS